MRSSNEPTGRRGLMLFMFVMLRGARNHGYLSLIIDVKRSGVCASGKRAEVLHPVLLVQTKARL